MPDALELTTLQYIREMQQRADLSMNEIVMLDKLSMAMDEIALLEREISLLRRDEEDRP